MFSLLLNMNQNFFGILILGNRAFKYIMKRIGWARD